jgi:hypothetical protein
MLTVDDSSVAPLENDHFYRLLLSFLHYLCAGSRVHATALLRQLRSFATVGVNQQTRTQYSTLINELEILFTGVVPNDDQLRTEEWIALFSGNREPINTQERRITRLSRQVVARRQELLDSLGRSDPTRWLELRGIADPSAVSFWRNYLDQLIKRGITAFTPEQIGPGFDQWLLRDRNLAVMLPTGSGKSIIGELRSALELASGHVVIWLLPTKALVRQVRRDLRAAFRGLNVRVEELPVTEDFFALIEDDISTQRYVAVSTPEKLQALLRQQPQAVRNVTLAVVDEAQLLFDRSRGTTLERVLTTLIAQAPNCKLTLMTAAPDRIHSLTMFLEGLLSSAPIELLTSQVRPTRRINGIATNSRHDGPGYARLLFFPAGLQSEGDTTRYMLKMHMRNVKLPDSVRTNPTAIGSRVTRNLTRASVRTVLFVGRRDSTETQAQDIVRARPHLPVAHIKEHFIARMRVELGRDSVTLQTAQYRVAPHHAGLTTLEQHMVETWLARGDINTIVATPTLAQGVNLPFDASIVTFTSRYNVETRQNEEIGVSEIQNMLGRAGRAGQVSDGICLLATSRSNANEQRDLDKSRHVFFRQPTGTSDAYGIHSLLGQALTARVHQQSWITELNDISFASRQ